MIRKNLMITTLAFATLLFLGCANDDTTNNGWDDNILAGQTDDEEDDNTDDEGGDPNKYGSLKSYIDRAMAPTFNLGAAVDAAQYANGGNMTSLINENFDQVVATYHMKHDQIVDATGAMDFTTVNKFVDAAGAAGLEVFGHTLCWHVGNENTYLDGIVNANSPAPQPTMRSAYARQATTWVELMKDSSCDAKDPQNTYALVVQPPTGGTINGEYKTEGDNTYLSIAKEFGEDAPWRAQFSLVLPEDANVGDQYAVSFKVRSGAGTELPKIMLQNKDFGYIVDIDPWKIPTTTEWTTASFTLNVGQPNVRRIVFSFGAAAADTFDFDDISVRKAVTDDGGEEPEPTDWYETLYNGDFEGDKMDNFYKNGKATATLTGAAGNPGRALKVVNAEAQAAMWESEFIIDTKIAGGMQVGDIYKVKFDVRAEEADKEFKIALFNEVPTQLATTPLGSVKPTSEWQTVEFTIDNTSGTYTGMSRIAFRMGTFVINAYFDNVSILSNQADDAAEGGGGGDEGGDTGDEHPAKEAVTAALESFVKGMLETTDGKVFAWDAVNEPLDDNNVTLLKSDNGATGNADFYWQDYLGQDYAREVVRLAREHGGNDIILFINEYGLSWSHTDKLGSLIDWVEYWESDGVTRFDGIASQMHISYFANDAQQATEEAAVIKMLTEMAATGKLVKISELDMQYKNENGKALKANELTAEMHQEMADYYEFIVSKFFEIVPAAQQYSITHWTPIDPSAAAGWRASEPVGLWNPDQTRKQQYAGFAEGLKGSDE